MLTNKSEKYFTEWHFLINLLTRASKGNLKKMFNRKSSGKPEDIKTVYNYDNKGKI